MRSPAGQFNGEVTVDTGVAVVNPGAAPARVRFTLRNSAGTALTSAEGILAPGQHIARVAAELIAVAPDFRFPPDFPNAVGYGSLDLESDQLISVTALRLTVNQRGELLFTSNSIVDLAAPPPSGPVYFPHLAEGGGFTSGFALLNTTSTPQTGSLQFLGDDGLPLRVNLTNGQSGSSFPYSIPAGGVSVVKTDGASSEIAGGWMRVTPDAGQSSPAGAGSFRFGQNGLVVTESGVSAATATTLARVYVDTSGGHDTGLAIANPGTAPLTATLRAYGVDGRTAVGVPSNVEIGAEAHDEPPSAGFIPGLPAGFRGVFEIESAQPFVALTVRSLVNSRGELLFATLQVADLRRPAPAPVIFPRIADGGGFRTELILLGTSGGAAATVRLFNDHGQPLPAIRP